MSERSASKFILAICCTVMLLGCRSQSNSPTGPTTQSGLFQKQSFSVAGENRRYHLYLPQNPRPAPIVFLLHGNSGSSDQILGLSGRVAPYKVWLDIASRENLILVVPDGKVGSNDEQGWNDCRLDARTNPDADDVLFLSSLMDEIRTSYGTGTSPVYVAGTSNGGLMTLRLSNEVPEKLNAIAIVVASKPVNSECIDSSVPVPVLFMNGTADPILPYNGGQIASDRGAVFSTLDAVDHWLGRNLTARTPVVSSLDDANSQDDSYITRFSYFRETGTGANAFGLVEHYEVVNGGHTEPSILERYGNLFKLVVGNQNGDIEMAEEIWRFFNYHN